MIGSLNILQKLSMFIIFYAQPNKASLSCLKVDKSKK